jgi:hypothetical protein
MSNIPLKISQLPAATQVNDADLVVIVQGADTKQATAEMVRAPTLLVIANLADLDDAGVARNNLGLGTAAVEDSSTFAKVADNNTFAKAQRGAYAALTSTGNSVAVDFALANHFSHTLTEDTTLATPTNVVAGQSGVIEVTQHASAAKTFAFSSFWKTPNGAAMTVSAVLDSKNVIAYMVDSSGTFATCNMSADVKTQI